MLVGFDAQSIRGKLTGLGTYTCRLLEALGHELPDSLKLCVLSQERPADRDLNTSERLWWENVSLPRLAKKRMVDLLHVPAFAPAFLKPCRLVVTVHDISGMLFPNQIGMASAFYWGKWLPFVIRKADRIIADSEHTKKDLIAHLGMRPERIAVVYPSGHETFRRDVPEEEIRKVKEKFSIHDRYWIFVGTLEPRKNLDRILDAFKVVSDTFKGHQLVLAGSKEFAYGKYLEILARDHGLNSQRIVAPGYLDHESLNALYAGADALIFPSLYEGFGIPILEAMASGCPVITSNTTSPPEVAGDAAVLVDPYDSKAIVDGMKRLASNENLRTELRCKGFEQIKKFSWKKAAREVIEVYKELLGYGR